MIELLLFVVMIACFVVSSGLLRSRPYPWRDRRVRRVDLVTPKDLGIDKSKPDLDIQRLTTGTITAESLTASSVLMADKIVAGSVRLRMDPDRDPFLMAMFRDYVATLADAGFLTGPVTAIDPKMLRETLCVAQAALSRSSYDADRRKEHLDRLGELIRRIDVIRPLDTAGQHGELHTPACGCDLSGELPPAVHIVDKHDD